MSQAQDTFWPDRYQDQIGVLTGGDIALATARQLVQEGATVYFCDISIERAQAAADQLNGLVPESAVAGQLDVTNEKQVSNYFDRIITDTGRIDFVLNSAGITDTDDMRAPIWELSMDQFRKRQEINLVGSAIVTKHASRVMIPRQYGRIVLIASNAAKEGNRANVEALLAKGCSIFKLNRDGLNVCEHACFHNEVELVDFLLQRGALVNCNKPAIQC